MYWIAFGLTNNKILRVILWHFLDKMTRELAKQKVNTLKK